MTGTLPTTVPPTVPSAASARDLRGGDRFPDLVLPDHDGHPQRLSELAGGDPLLLHTYRGWWCPKERAFRAGLDAHWPFLSDPERTALAALGLRETTDTAHDPYLPTVWLLGPDLTVHRWWLGYWYWGRPTLDELRVGLREITRALRPDWDPPRPDAEA